jgi:hypothetical protein
MSAFLREIYSAEQGKQSRQHSNCQNKATNKENTEKFMVKLKVHEVHHNQDELTNGKYQQQRHHYVSQETLVNNPNFYPRDNR